jgi:hypothetical protein
MERCVADWPNTASIEKENAGGKAPRVDPLC